MQKDDWKGVCGEPRLLLMCGNDQILLEVRCRILQRVGYKAESVTNAKEMLARLESDRRYGLFVLCHTVPVERRDTLRTLALRKGIPVYQIERPLFPGDLITDVSKQWRRLHGSSHDSSGRADFELRERGRA